MLALTLGHKRMFNSEYSLQDREMNSKRRKDNDGGRVLIGEIWTDEVHIRKRIQWTTACKRLLVELYNKSRPSEARYMNRILGLWKQANPDLMITATALRQRLYIMRNQTSSDILSEDSYEEWEDLEGNEARNIKISKVVCKNVVI